jgi:hypothetical protein
MGILEMSMGRPEKARKPWMDAVNLARRIGELDFLMTSLGLMAILEVMAGNRLGADEYLRQMDEIAERANDPELIALAKDQRKRVDDLPQR